MRIVSGTHKGRRIHPPKKLPVRPTTDMAKEALFNILNNSYYFDDLTVVDIFAGTGNISYEFASRGAKEIIAVDAHQACVSYIAHVAADFDFPIQAVKSDVFIFLTKTTFKSDIIFADPPYAMPLEDFTKIHDVVFSKDLLLEGGVLIIEHSKHMDLSFLSYFSSQRKYGGTAFSFFKATSLK